MEVPGRTRGSVGLGSDAARDSSMALNVAEPSQIELSTKRIAATHWPVLWEASEPTQQKSRDTCSGPGGTAASGRLAESDGERQRTWLSHQSPGLAAPLPRLARPSGAARCSVGQAGHAHRCPLDEGSLSQGGEICGETQGEHRQLLHILCERRHVGMWSRAASDYWTNRVGPAERHHSVVGCEGTGIIASNVKTARLATFSRRLVIL